MKCLCEWRGDNPYCPVDHDQVSHEGESMDDVSKHQIFIQIIQLMEEARLKMEKLRIEDSKWDKRALSIAITELETSQLWLTNATPE